MAVLTKFDCFTLDLMKGVHKLHTDTLKVALTNSAPLATYTTLSQITQVAGGAYVDGGFTLGPAQESRLSSSAGAGRLTLDDYQLTATGADMPTFRYLVLYNATAAGGPLIGWTDYGEAITLKQDEYLLLDFADVTTGGAIRVS